MTTTRKRVRKVANADDTKTPESIFLIKYQTHITPITRYPDYLAATAKPLDWIFNDIKRAYKKFVIDSGWTEKKLITSLDNIFHSGYTLDYSSIEKSGKLFDQGKIEFIEIRIRKHG